MKMESEMNLHPDVFCLVFVISKKACSSLKINSGMNSFGHFLDNRVGQLVRGAFATSAGEASDGLHSCVGLGFFKSEC